ncbi:hypothetical protein SprV_0200586700 [Sparganum proliferum]
MSTQPSSFASVYEGITQLLEEKTLTSRPVEPKPTSPAFDVYEPLHALPYSAATTVPLMSTNDGLVLSQSQLCKPANQLQGRLGPAFAQGAVTRARSLDAGVVPSCDYQLVPTCSPAPSAQNITPSQLVRDVLPFYSALGLKVVVAKFRRWLKLPRLISCHETNCHK